MRARCPACNSSTALGEVICFKCGYISAYRTTPGYMTDVSIKQFNDVVSLRDNVEMDPKKFPPKALMWLYKASIYDDKIRQHKIAYCRDINKVLVPAFKSDGELAFYQLRSLDDSDPEKYLTRGKTAAYAISDFNHIESKTVVFVEDRLSAIRIAPFFNVQCLSGTKINYSVLKQLLEDFNHFIFWLDPDQPGREALYKNLQTIRYGAEATNVKRMFLDKEYVKYEFSKVNYDIIKKDPKYYLDHEIKRILSNNIVKI